MATWLAVSRLGARTKFALRSACRRRPGSGIHTSIPCVQTIVFIFGANKRIARATGARLGCPTTTSFARLLAMRTAVVNSRALPRSHPVKTNSRSPTDIRCKAGVSFRLSIRHSIARVEANSERTAATCRPVRCTPPGASSSGKSPIITRRVCQVSWRNARRQIRVMMILSAAPRLEKLHQVGEAIQINIRGMRSAVVDAKPVVHYRRKGARVPCCLYVHLGITDKHGLAR